MNKNQVKGIAAGIGYFALYACLMMIFQTVYTFVLMGIEYAFGVRDEAAFEAFANDNLLIAVLMTIASVGLAFYLVFRCRGRDVLREWRVCPFTFGHLLPSVFVALAYSLAYAYLSSQIMPDEPNPIFLSADYYSTIYTGLGPLLMAVNLLVAAPIVEEMVMRGIVYTRIEKDCGKWAAIIVSSLLFGLMHISAGGALLAVGAVLMGAVFALIFAKTNSLPVCIIAHAAANIPDLMTYLMR